MEIDNKTMGMLYKAKKIYESQKDINEMRFFMKYNKALNEKDIDYMIDKIKLMEKECDISFKMVKSYFKGLED